MYLPNMWNIEFAEIGVVRMIECHGPEGLLAGICMIKSKAISYLGGIPFMLATKQGDEVHFSLNKNRILEALVIAGATAGITALITGVIFMNKLESKFDMFQVMAMQNRAETKARMDKYEAGQDRLEDYIINLHETGKIARIRK